METKVKQELGLLPKDEKTKPEPEKSGRKKNVEPVQESKEEQ